MAKRKNILNALETSKEEFLILLNDALSNYSSRCYDIEAFITEMGNCTAYILKVYKR